jgi:CheY-like chemotaxis protein
MPDTWPGVLNQESDLEETVEAVTSRATILVVEDESDLRNTVAEVLQLDGYEVETAGNGREALELLDDGLEPTLILLDVMMPEMDGRAFRRHQLDHPDYADIPVLIFTSSQDADLTEFNAVEILRKPIGIDALLDAVESYTGSDPPDWS